MMNVSAPEAQKGRATPQPGPFGATDDQEDALQAECCSHFIPVLKREADKSRGEVFPLIWYASDGEVTATQHFILAKTVLIAENPSLK